MGISQTKHDLSGEMDGGSCGTHSSGMWGGGRSYTNITRGTADIVWGCCGFECELQLLLGLEHFWNRGSWGVFPDALFEQLFPLQIEAVWRREC